VTVSVVKEAEVLISELAVQSGVPLATVKFYLREGLLAPGSATSATRAIYGQMHVRRLRLVRALVEVGGLRLAVVREVLAALDDPSRSKHDVLGAAHDRLAAQVPAVDQAALDAADAHLARLGWRVHPQAPHRRVLARALAACTAVGHPVDPATIDTYARAALMVAEVDLASVPTTDRALAMERVVIGTVLHEPLLLALRRLAQAHVSARLAKR